MENYSDNELKLIYVLKIGYNSKNEGMYEFIFSIDENNIDVEGWSWDVSPAANNAEPPEEDYVNKVVNLKTKSFDLFCLHEAVDREYMHGFHTIHALAYETFKDDSAHNMSDYEHMFESEINDDVPLLVFHYGMTLKTIKEMFESRNIILKNNEFVETSSIKF